jgi:hypothetical protein
VKYLFFINLINPVSSKGKLEIEFSSEWVLKNGECILVGGVPEIDEFNIPECKKEEN